MADRFGELAFAAFVVLALLIATWLYWPGQTGPSLLDDATSVLVIGDLNEHPELAWDYLTGDSSGPLGRPVSIASFVLEKLLLGDSLAVSKRVNILLHLFNGVLLMWLFGLLFRHIGTPGYRWLSLVLGAMWLVAPLYVSTVLYVVQRMAMLSTTFMLTTCISYIYFREKVASGETAIAWLLAAIVSLLLSVFAKENAVVVIPILLLMEALWFQFLDKNGSPIRWLRQGTCGLIALGGIGLLLFFDYEGLAAGYGHRYFSLDERLLTQTRILWDYVGQWYAPNVLVMGLYHDDYVVSTSLTSPASTLYAVLGWVAVLLISTLLLLWRWGRYFALGIAWFLVGHSVESTVFPLELYFEHRNYFPAIGLLLLIGLLFSGLAKCWGEVKAPLLVYLACYALWLASLTSSQVQIWSSHPLLILQHLNGHPHSFRANSDMAVQMANLGEVGEARKYSARAYAVSRGERSGDHDIRDLALACIANQPVAPEQIEQLGIENPERPFGSVITLHTLVKLLQDGVCPAFDSVRFADRMTEIFLADNPQATASANMYLGLALLEHTLQRWQNAEQYVDLYLEISPGNTQGMLMKLHFVTALGKVNAADAVKSQLLQLQDQGELTVGEQQTLSLYLEN